MLIGIFDAWRNSAPSGSQNKWPNPGTDGNSEKDTVKLSNGTRRYEGGKAKLDYI